MVKMTDAVKNTQTHKLQIHNVCFQQVLKTTLKSMFRTDDGEDERVGEVSVERQLHRLKPTPMFLVLSDLTRDRFYRSIRPIKHAERNSVSPTNYRSAGQWRLFTQFTGDIYYCDESCWDVITLGLRAETWHCGRA